MPPAKTNKYLVQVWLAPAAPVTDKVELPGSPPVILRNVKVRLPNGRELDATLLEMDGTQEEMMHAPEKDFRRLGRVVSRLCFTLLTPFQVFSARLVPKPAENARFSETLVFPGAPPGIGLFQGRVGFNKSVVFDPALLSGDLDPSVEGAITWFLKGFFGANATEQVVSYWIGLEMLIPSKEGAWKCSKCGERVPVCPHCGAATDYPKVFLGIAEFLERELGTSRREARLLYDLRCRISHGSIAMDFDGVQKVSEHVFRLQELLMGAIKKALGRSVDAPPNVEGKGAVLAAVPGLCFDGASDAIVRDQPGALPPDPIS